jgi:predicted esterase
MRALAIETATHGRVLVRDTAGNSPWLVGFHGYGQNAEDMLAELERLPGAAKWNLASVQALHRFYTRDNQRVIASWMTREDREFAIADNIAYIDRVLDELVARQASGLSVVEGTSGSPVIVFAGFSQGAAMAYRAGVLGRHHASGIIALGGDIPPDVRDARDDPWPRVLIGAGVTDFWYTPPKVDADVAFLESRDLPHEVVRFSAGHEWTDEFRAAAGAWLERVPTSERPT